MKKKHPEHVNLERWLVSYADFITLLFAFFVVMYAISQANATKFKAVSQSIRSAFESSGPSGMVDLGAASGGKTINLLENTVAPGGRAQNLPAGKANTAAEVDTELREIRELLEESISLELGATEVSTQLEMLFDERGLVVRVAVKDFFDPGEVKPRSDVMPLLDKIGAVLAQTQRSFRIEGHTAVDEEKNTQYISGWDLAASRATWVGRYWIRKFKLNPERAQMASDASYRPLSVGRDPWDQAKNRRIELLFLNHP